MKLRHSKVIQNEVNQVKVVVYNMKTLMQIYEIPNQQRNLT